MEVRLMFMCSAILLSLSSVIKSNSDVYSEFDKTAINGLSTSKSTVVQLYNTFHFSSMEQIPTTDKDDTTQIEDTTSQRTPVDQNKLTEAKIDSLMHRIDRIESMLSTLYIKFNRNLDTSDERHKQSSTKINFGLMEVPANSRKTIPNLQTVPEIVDKPIQIGNESPLLLQDKLPNNEFNDNDITGLIRNSFILTNPTETKTQKITDRYTDNFTTSETKEATNNSEVSKGIYRTIKKDTKRVILELNKFNCDELQVRLSGIYKFASRFEKPNEAERFYYERYCDFATADGVAWTVIQRRFANNHQLSFNKTWSEYKFGFGSLDSEFWFGNDFIYKLTSERDMELRIIFEDENGNVDWCEFSLFKMKSEDEHYKLEVEGYTGTIVSFQNLNGQDFSTFDRRHVKNDNLSCASDETGRGWRFKNCTQDILGNWLGTNSMKMMIRPAVISTYWN